jgi:integrase
MAKLQKSFSVGEYAEIMGVHPQTVYKWIYKGWLKVMKLGNSRNSSVRILKESAMELQERFTFAKSRKEDFSHLPKISVSLREYDKSNLGDSSMSKGGNRWNYKHIGAIRTRTTSKGIVRYYYQLWVTEDNGKRKRIEKICKHAINRQEAIKELEKARMDYLQNRYNEKPKLKKGRFEELSGSFLEYIKGEKSYVNYKSHIVQENGLNSFFGKKEVSEITSLDVKEYVNIRKEIGSSENTINHHLSTLRHMLHLAEEWNWELSNNKVKNIIKTEFFVEVDSRNRVISRKEEGKLYKELSSKLKQVFTIALHTGLRPIEMLSLKWSDINLEERKIKISLEDTKTKKHRRTIPISNVLFAVIMALKNSNGTSEWVFPSNRTDTHIKDIPKGFDKACERAGIEDLTFYDTRRTYATRLHFAGIPLYKIMKLLGHRNLKTTQIYLGLEDDEDFSDVVTVLDQKVGNIREMNSIAVDESIVSPANLMG